jgi:hypothetical protein
MVMIKSEHPYPPPESWTPVFVSWERMLEHRPLVHDLLFWIEQVYEGHGQYQLRGPADDPASGFLFYFEDSRDAGWFVLHWGGSTAHELIDKV